MAKDYFEFKKFKVYHNLCAMKVGTDGVLLGAWAKVEQAHSVLDIGVGSGLVALMLAQRCNARITGIDIDDGAVKQALINVVNSPWAQRIVVEKADACSYTAAKLFDVVVSNPPYFEDSLVCPSNNRTLARHTCSLQFEQLICCVNRNLRPDGSFFVVLPAVACDDFVHTAWIHNLFLNAKCSVTTVEGKAPKRVLLGFSHQDTPQVLQTSLSIQTSDGLRTAAYSDLISDFFIR